MMRITLFFLTYALLTACTSVTTPPLTSTPISTPAVSSTFETLTPILTEPSRTNTPTPELTKTLTPTKTSTSSPTSSVPVSLQPDNPYYILYAVSLEVLMGADDQELMRLAPDLTGVDYARYNFREGEIASLDKSEVVRLGSNPFVIYKDNEGEVSMWWNVEKGEIEHVQKSEYIDPQTSFKVEAFMVTDNSWVENFSGKWWEKNEINEGDTAKLLFEYPLAINNMWNNHNDEFESNFNREYGTPKNDHYWDPNTTDSQLDNFRNRGISLLRSDIDNLEGDEEIKVDLGRNGDFKLNKEGVSLQVRFEYSHKYSSRDWFFSPYYDFDLIDVVSEGNSAELTVNMDRNYMLNLYGAWYVGGPMVSAIRQITAANNASGIADNGEINLRSVTDTFLEISCDPSQIGNYLSFVRDEYGLIGAPYYDVVNTSSYPHDCLLKQR